ncbi:MAG: PAS-domain containing protein, partial [Pseudomonadota bacterium]
MSDLWIWTPTALGAFGMAGGVAVALAERRRRRAAEALTMVNALADADAQSDADDAMAALTARADAAIAEAEGRAATAHAQAVDLRAVADAAPVPMWRRGPTGAVLWRNAAAQAAGDVDALSPAKLFARAQRLGGRHSESRTVVVDGDRRLYDVAEDVGPEGGVGWAADMTGVADARDMLERHLAQTAAVLDNLSCGVEVYGPDKRLRFHNPAFAEMAGLDVDWLDDSPRMGEVLDEMRRARRLPESADYAAFRRDQLALFQSVLEPTTEVIHLPGGVAWRMTAIPHADGGLVLIYEDATDTLGLERDVNILLDVRRATIDHLLEGVAVFGADGRLKLYNPAFQRLWRLTPMTLAHEPHVLDVAGDAQAFFSGDGDWSAFRDWMSEAVFER